MFTADCQDTTGTINKNGTSWHPTIASIGEITCITCTCHVSVLHVTIHDCLSFFVRSSKKDATILVLAIKWRYLKKIFDLAIAPLYTQYWMILMNEIKMVLIRNTTQKEKKNPQQLWDDDRQDISCHFVVSVIRFCRHICSRYPLPRYTSCCPCLPREPPE